MGLLDQVDPECAAHWAKVRADLAAGRRPIEKRPLPSLADQADAQIKILERDLEEWRAIKRKAESDAAAGVNA